DSLDTWLLDRYFAARMFLLIPYEVRTMSQRNPWANLAILLLTVVMFVITWYDVVPSDVIEAMILEEGNWTGWLGHVLLHAGWMHLIGNMLFLFVFGNAVCGVMNSFLFAAMYVLMGIVAAGVHMLFDGDPAVGASGALCGVMGMYLAIYPLNRINCFWLFMVRAGTFGMPGWVLILLWFAADLFGAFGKGGDVAHWAHVGGTVAGFVTGLLLLKAEKVDLFDYDNPSMLDLMPGQRVVAAE
ncbi:MAG: rhomboid family intramembrane serine protease, partial [Verrucomicrobiaceae bacterium]